MNLHLGKERVIVQGIRPEEKLWGPYQFPQSFDLGDRLVVSVHVENDNINTFGLPQRWFESRDTALYTCLILTVWPPAPSYFLLVTTPSPMDMTGVPVGAA